MAIPEISGSSLESIDYQSLLDNYIDESYLIVDTNLNVIKCSRSFHKNYHDHFKKDIRLGTCILEYVPEGKTEIVRDLYQRALSGEQIEVDLELPIQNRIFYSFRHKYKPLYDTNGHIAGVFVSTLNLAPSKIARIENLQNEMRYNHVVQNSFDAFFFSTREGRILEVNDAACEIFGYTREELLKLNRDAIIDHNDAGFTENLRKRDQKGKMKGIATGIRKKGERFSMEYASVLYEDPTGQLRACSFVNDISVQKKNIKLLEQNEKRFQALIENSSDIILMTNIKGSVQYTSPAFERITGFTFAELQTNQKLLTSRVHPDYLENVKHTFFESLSKPGVPIPRQFQFCHKDGHYIWLQGVITNFLDNESIRAVVSNYIDISQNKLAEARVAGSENRFRALVEKGEDIIVLSNTEGLISYVSPAFEKLTGFSATETTGRYNLEFMHPEQAAITPGIFEKLLSSPGTSIPRTNRLKRKDGTYVWVEGYITNLLHDENVQALVSNYHDISERLKAAELIRNTENNLKAIFENSSEAFLLIDHNRIVKAFNANAAKIGLLNTNHHISIGSDILDSIEKSRREMIKLLMEKALNGENIVHERNYINENGTALWIEYTINPVHENGRITGCCITGRDITARKLAEEEVKKRELRFRSILENSNDFLILFDPHGKVEFLSPAVEKVFGHVNRAAKTNYFLDKVHPEDIQITLHKLKQALDNPDESVTFSFRKRKKNGGYLWLEGTLTNMLHKQEVKMLVGNFRDTTERKQFEEQQALLVSIVNSSEDAILSVNLDNTILTWNHGAEKMFGFSAAEAVGKNCRLIIPPDREQEEVDILYRVQSGISVKHYETRLKNKNEELLDISLTVSPIKDNSGKITGASKIAHDISDKKKNEEIIRNNEQRFRSLLQNSNDGLSLLAPDGTMLEISPAGKRILGFEDDQMVGLARADLIHPEDLEHVSKAFTDVIEDPSKTRFFEYRTLTNTGAYKWMEASSQNLLNDPAVGAIVVNYRDITDRKNQEIEREQLIKTLNQNNNDLLNFSYITSHNLKAPLSNLMGFIELLADIPIEDPTLATIIDGFRTSSIQLNNTINDLVKILIIRDSDAIEQKEISFGKIFGQVQNTLASQIDEVNPVIDLHFENAPTVFFNETYLESIFMNLITNAIRYRSYDRPLKIEVKTRKEENAVILTFSDNGIGFDAIRHKSKIFGLYQRFHDRPNSKGLGLYLIKSQMESLQGTIDVDSTVDVGTSFTLKFHA